MRDLAKQMINYKLVTKQTKPEGVLVEKVTINQSSIVNKKKIKILTTFFLLILLI